VFIVCSFSHRRGAVQAVRGLPPKSDREYVPWQAHSNPMAAGMNYHAQSSKMAIL